MYKPTLFFFDRNILFLYEMAHNLLRHPSIMDINMICCLFTFWFTYKKIHYFCLKFFEYWWMNTVHVTTTTIKIQNCDIALKVSPRGLFIVNPFPHLGNHWSIFCSYNLVISRIHKNEEMEDVAFWIWLLSLSIMRLSSINVVCVFHLYLMSSSLLLYGGTSLFIHLPVEGHLGLLQFLKLWIKPL